MALAICDEHESPQARVAWIQELAHNAKRGGSIRDLLMKASTSSTPEVRTASSDALVEFGPER
jgi:hypothetical protein